jgi:putative colanic acid biosynthesis acetyltransferase WcaF
MNMASTRETKVRNDLFDAKRSFNRERPLSVFAAWMIIRWLFFTTSFPWPSPIKVRLLRLFGAKVGKQVYLKPRISIHFPWKLVIGDFSWIGEEVTIVNFEPISIGNHCCISQRAFLCSGNHDFRDPAMGYRNAPITIMDGVWVGATSSIGPGTTLGVDTVISLGSVVLNDLPDNGVYRGHPAVRVADRWK